ncbi:MAG TPA: helicase-exonuclease AddAB subunit AddA [Oscillospiraceae bacterium]|nr:helicase-exonuclease AddAB subunit AddA [Oscillospiraceae bacterium]
MPELTAQQRAAVADRGGLLLVSAAAGSGKTRVLVERLLSRVEAGSDITRFLVITYTKAAAGELRVKIASELSRRVAASPENRHLRRQTGLLYAADIKTVHSFCASLLRERAPLADLTPDFRVLEEDEASLLLRRVLDDLLEKRYEDIGPESDFARLVDLFSFGRDDRRLVEIVLDLYGKLRSHPWPEAWMETQLRALSAEDVLDAGETMWGELLLSRARRETRHWRETMERAAAEIASEEKLERGYGESFRATEADLAKLEQTLDAGWDAAAEARVSFPPLRAVRGFGDPARQERLKDIRARCKKAVERMADSFDAKSGELLSDLRAMYPALRGLFALLRDLDRAAAKEKERLGALDFGDLEQRAIRLLLTPGGAPTPAAGAVAARYEEILVDEYQDTNGAQNAIFSAVSRKEENLFFVGDVKQSIYRFRLADPTIFLRRRESCRDLPDAEAGQPRRAVLSQNFRSRPEVLSAVNFLFRNLMSRDFGEVDYTADEFLYPAGSFAGTGADCRTELHLIETPEAGEDEERPAAAEAEAGLVADRVKALLDEGFPLSDEGTVRPARPRDVVVLLRSPGPVLPYYLRAFAARGIPCGADAAGGFFETVEVQVALSLLAVIDNPHQDVPLISALRSPVFGFSPDRLALLRAGTPAGDFYDALRASEDADCRAAVGTIERLREAAGDLSAHEVVWNLLADLGLPAMFGALPAGEARQENLFLLYEYARHFEENGHKGLFGFLRHLEGLRGDGRDLPGRRAGAGDAVRIMSIHRSKGLEFPVVVLAGLGRRFNRVDLQKPILVHANLGVGPNFFDAERLLQYPTLPRRAIARVLDEELRAEELRLLYVAMTRGKEKLILTCAVKDAEKTLRRLAPDVGRPVAPEALSGMQTAGDWVLTAVLTRPEAAALREAAQVPYAPYEDDGDRWRIELHRGAAEGTVSAPAPEETVEAPIPEGAEKPFLPVPDFGFVYPYAAAENLPSKRTATQLKGRFQDAEAAAETRVARPPRFERPRFVTARAALTAAERGTALHLAMQFIDVSKTGSLADIRAELSRMRAMRLITDEQADAVPPGKLLAFFASPLGRRVKAGPARREFKFSLLADAAALGCPEAAGEEILLQGMVDCYLDEPDGLTVIDFKTDAVRPGEEPQRAEAYRTQLTVYADALTRITGRTVKEKCLYFFETDCAYLLS